MFTKANKISIARFALFLILVIGMLGSGPIQRASAITGGTWYVATTGDDANNCLAASTPCATINSAINKSAGGDTILIAEGTYVSDYPFYQARFLINKPLTLSGGWNNSFLSRSGVSILDAEGSTTTVLYISSDATLERLLIQDGYTGIGIATSTSVTVKQSSIYGMSDWGITNSGNTTLENVTISGNLDGGVYNSGTMSIVNSTITANSSSEIPAGINGNTNVTIQNSILAGNTKDGAPSDCYGNVTSLGNNIIGAASGCSITAQPGDLVGVNPQVGVFLVGGYHALLASSPAIDSGNASACPTIDQRGVPRPQGGACDIGAYEYTVPGSAVKVMVQAGAYQVAGINTPLTQPIKALVLDSAGSPVSGSTVTFLAPASGPSGNFASSGTNQATAVTDVNGIASAPTFTTNSISGTYDIVASVNGMSETAKFAVANAALYVKPTGNDGFNCLTPARACSTIAGALNKSPVNAKILIAEGTYTGSGSEVVYANKSIYLSGGWDTSFTAQNKQSVIDGQNSRVGIYITDDSTVNIDHFLTKNSIAGIRNLGTANLVNSSFFNNQTGVDNEWILSALNITSAQNSEYGIVNQRTLTLQYSTIAGNVRGIYNGSYTLASTTIQNSILANNDRNCEIGGGSIKSAGYNVIDSTAGCPITLRGSDLVGVDPQLTLVPSLGIYALSATSPAIDSANAACPPTDQRGVTRPQGAGCDIGAYESDTVPATVTSIVRAHANPTALSSVNFTVTFSEAVVGVSPHDFALTTSGVAAASISTTMSGTGATYTISVNTGAGSGTIRLDLVDDDGIKDLSDNPLGGAGTGNGNYICGEAYNTLKGADTAGVFRPMNGLLYLKNKNETGFAELELNYGIPGDYPVVGDWDGDGTVTIGVYRQGKFYLRNSNTVGFADAVFAFGQVGDQPVAGDWDGDGIDTIGVYRPSNGQFLLRNRNDAGPADASFYLGNVGDVGIAGDWDGDGKDTTGVFRPINGIIFLKNSNTTGFAEIALNYGIPGDKPVTGDWNNDGIDTIGVYRNGQFMLRNTNDVGFADIVFGLGNPGDMPIAGNWDGVP